MKNLGKVILGVVLSLMIITPVFALTFIKDEKIDTLAYTIVDKSKDSGIMSAQVLEKFYEDDNYEYYYSSSKKDLVVVEYSNGTVITVSEALKMGKITIDELDDYGILYYSEEK